jgi:CDP-diacylglycerol--serine O-phosphatidyltransferase
MREILQGSGAAAVALVSPAGATMFGRFCWMAGAAYVACTALRLARFNVENDQDESAHMGFKGLPSPGAAGALISVILLHKEVLPEISPTLLKFSQVTALAVPFVTLSLGLLMVSRIPYAHMVNRYLRGRKPFWMLVAMFFFVLAFLSWPQLVLAVGMCGFAASGPIAYLVHRIRRTGTAPAPSADATSSSSPSIPKE